MTDSYATHISARRVTPRCACAVAASLLLIVSAASAHAQTCSALPLDLGEKSWGGLATDAPGFGVIGSSYLKEYENSLSVSYTPSPVAGADGSIGLGYRIAKEILVPKAPAPQRPFRTCLVSDWTSVATGNVSVSTLTVGPGLAAGPNKALTFFGSPQIGFVVADKNFAIATSLLGGVSIRSGNWYGAMDVGYPLRVVNASPTFSFRVSMVTSKAKPKSATAQPSAAPTEGSGQQQTRTSPSSTSYSTQQAPRVEPAPASNAAPVAGTKPYSIDDIAAMVSNGVSTARILELGHRSCVSFRITDAVETRLRRAGSDPELIEGLRHTCFAAQ